MAVSNQNIVRVGTRDAFDKSHTYCLMHIDSLQAAMCNLKGETLKLWLYCNKNQNGYQFELSQKALQEWGLKKDAYQTAKKKLMELGYLVPASEDSNVLIFCETLSEKPTNPTESVFQIQSEKQTMIVEEIGSEKPTSSEFQMKIETSESEKPTKCLGKMSEKPTTLSGFPTSQSEKAQRNNTIVHNSTLKDSTNMIFGESEEEQSDSYPTIQREFVHPEYIGKGLVKNGDKIFKLVE